MPSGSRARPTPISSWWPTGCRSTWRSSPTARSAGSTAPADWSPRWSRCCAAGTAPGSAGRGWPTPRSSRSSRTACSCTRCGCPRRRSRTTTRASPTARCGRSTTTWSRRPRSTGTGGRPTCGSTSASPRSWPKVAAPGATVWVQDYQLQLRAGRAPRAASRPADRVLPAHPVPAHRAVHAAAVAHGGSSRACSAPTWSASTRPGGARNFRWLATRLAGASAGHGRTEVVVRRPHGQARRVPDLDRLAPRSTGCRAAPEVQERAKQIRADLGDPKRVVLGVDRLDYTKGIDVRLRAFEELLAEGRVEPPRTP